MSKNKKILVIEDHPDVRENIEEILELASYDVVTAENGKIGVKKAIDELPDLIICDIMMPELDGYEVLYLLGKNMETAGIPFIFLTAKAEKEDFRRGMNLGADDYLVKPFEEMDLLNTIEKRLKRVEELRGMHTKNVDQFVTEISSQYPKANLTEGRGVRSFKKGASVYNEGDFPNYLYQIKSGKVKTFKINSDGKELITAILGEGDYLGVVPLIQDSNHTEFAEVMEDCELITIPRQDFQALVFQNKEISTQFIKMLSMDLESKEKELMAMAYDTVRKRTADALVKLYDSYKSSSNTSNVKFSIHRDDLASIIGTATESAIRMLSEFRKENWIRIEGGKIEILDINKLRSVKY